jgi:hypothetical protein
VWVSCEKHAQSGTASDGELTTFTKQSPSSVKLTPLTAVHIRFSKAIVARRSIVEVVVLRADTTNAHGKSTGVVIGVGAHGVVGAHAMVKAHARLAHGWEAALIGRRRACHALAKIGALAETVALTFIVIGARVA